MQSLCGIAHFDYNIAGAYSYEQAFQVMRGLELDYSQIEQFYRRMVFKVVARNKDDHTKNIAFLMDKSGTWKLSPAFDVTYSYHPEGDWTKTHQMSINNKRDEFTHDDLIAAGGNTSIKPRRDKAIIDEVAEVVSQWQKYADMGDVAKAKIKMIAMNHRLL